MRVDTLLENAAFHTLDDAGTVAEALAVQAGRIVALGSRRELAGLGLTADRVMDLEGRCVLPGFIDAHEHLSIFADHALQVDLSPARTNSIAAIQEAVARAARDLPPGEWIRGSLYNDAATGDGRILTREDLDRAAPNNPVFVVHVSVHWGVANSLALAAGGLDEGSVDPEGGVLERDSTSGRLTGRLIETACFDFAFDSLAAGPTVVPPFPRAVRASAVRQAALRLAQAGVTSVGDALVGPSAMTTYLDLAREGRLPIRVNMLLTHRALDSLERLGLAGPFGGDRVRCGGIKIIVDGAISGRTAAVSGGYPHDPDYAGVLLLDSQEHLDALVGRIHDLGYQACLHANGDVAIRMCLAAIAKAQAANPRPDPRHRIEHCSLVDGPILSEMRRLGVMALPFASYAWQHGDHLEGWFGDRARAMFPHASFLRAGVAVAASSDHPAGLHPPLLGVRSMVTRLSRSGKPVGLSERIALEEALRMYGPNAARATFEEDVKGVLAPGMLADLAVLGGDPWGTAPESLADIPVDMTMVGGEVVFSRL